MGGAASILLALGALYFSSQTLLGRTKSSRSYFWVKERGRLSVLAASETPARLEPGESYGDKEKVMEPVSMSRVLELLHFI